MPQFLLENLEVGKLMLEPVRLSQSSLKLGAGIECLFCCVAEGPSLPRGPWHLHGLQEAVPLPLAWVCQHAFLWGCGGHMPSLMAGCLCRLTPVCPQGAWPGAPWHVCLTLLPPCCSVCTQVLAVGASQWWAKGLSCLCATVGSVAELWCVTGCVWGGQSTVVPRHWPPSLAVVCTSGWAHLGDELHSNGGACPARSSSAGAGLPWARTLTSAGSQGWCKHSFPAAQPLLLVLCNGYGGNAGVRAAGSPVLPWQEQAGVSVHPWPACPLLHKELLELAQWNSSVCCSWGSRRFNLFIFPRII